MTHGWVKHAKDAKHCSECGAALTVGPIRHVVGEQRLDALGHDRIASCTCGWRKDSVWHVPEPKPVSGEKSKAAMAAHLAEAAEIMGPRCPNEPAEAEVRRDDYASLH